MTLGDNETKLMLEYKNVCRRFIGLVGLLFVVGMAQPAMATTSRSPGYEVSEAEFGAGSALETCSGSYCAKASIGAMAGDDMKSPSFTASFSPAKEDSEPSLEVMIEPGTANLGELSQETTAHRTMKVHVRSHLAGGYLVQLVGQAPHYEQHTLATPSSPTASTPGKEQFALNAVANTTPEVGENPHSDTQQNQATQAIRPAYATPDRFAYTSGDIIARTDSESSQIRYTISMIVNIAGSTPAGHFSSDFSAVITPVF